MSEQLYLKRDCFELEKVKISKDDIDVKFIALEKTKKGTVRTPGTLTPSYQAHKDLLNTLAMLRTYLRRDFGYNKLMDAIPAKHKTKEIISVWDEMVDNTTITGISIFGKDTNRGCIITGTIKCDSGTHGVPSNRIMFGATSQGYEKEVEVIVESIIDEVHACVFEGKRANEDLFSGQQKETKKKEKPAKEVLKKA